jgi:hypothetical protein
VCFIGLFPLIASRDRHPSLQGSTAGAQVAERDALTVEAIILLAGDPSAGRNYQSLILKST